MIILIKVLFLIVEKPAFLSRSEALQVLELASFTGSKVMEGFMHRFSKSYKLAMQFFASNVLSELNVSFLIDKLPENTFRGLESIKDSSLFDIGSYPVSLFVDIDLVDLALSIDSYRIQERAERISVVGATRSATVSFDVGVSEEYKNEIDAKFANGDRLRISPFFYGRSGKRTAEIWSRGSFELHDIYETNTFTSMFDEFLRNEVSPHRGTIVQVATILESLSLELNDHRMHELKKP